MQDAIVHVRPVGVAEKFIIRRSIAGWIFVPIDGGTLLLAEMLGDEPAKVTLPLDQFPSLDGLISEIRRVAIDLGASVQVCGDWRRYPTVILRRRPGSLDGAPVMPERRVDLKWCVFGQSRETWIDHGYSDLIDALSSMVSGQWLRVLSRPSKECRFADVVIRRVGAGSWRVSGVMTDAWDEAPDLAESFGVLLQECLSAADGEPPEDEGERMAWLAAYNARHGADYQSVMTESEFCGCIPMSAAAAGPGLDHEFDRRFRCGVDGLLDRLSAMEGRLIKEAAEVERRWLQRGASD